MSSSAADMLEAKRRARREVAAALVRLTPSERRAASIALAERVAAVPAVADATTLMAFLSLATEIDTWPIIRWAWRRGKRVAIPRIEFGPGGEDVPLGRRTMVAVRLDAADVDEVGAHPAVRPGPLGILDAPDAPVVPLREIDVVLLPCQALDRSGNRLGKGGGFYDRFLAQPDVRAVRVGIGFRHQLLDQVPVSAEDQRVDVIVTDAETLVFNR